MARFLFSTIGSLGDLHPYIAIAQTLIQRGHQAVILTPEDHRSIVETAGVEYVPIPPSLDELGDRDLLLQRLFDVRRGPEYIMRLLVMPYLRAVYDQQLLAADGADLLISHPLTMTLPLVAERRQIPWVSTVLSPMSFMSCYDPPLIPSAAWVKQLRRLGLTPYSLLFRLMKLGTLHWERPLHRFRRELGFAPTRQRALFEGQFSPLLNLALFDPHLAPAQPDWPANTRICGSPMFDGQVQDNAVVDDLARFLDAGEPPIVFALGSSAVWVAGDFWNQAAAAAVRLGRRAILLTGPITPTGLPENVRAYKYLPYSHVFPQAAAVVHQAGIGTLAQALRAGRPQLIVPVAFDQPDNAHRAQSLGIARTLPFKKVNADRLTAELKPLLQQPDYTTQARRLADDLAATDGAARAADELIACLQSTA
jgi:rhamnosyltransferase subunit B